MDHGTSLGEHVKALMKAARPKNEDDDEDDDDPNNPDVADPDNSDPRACGRCGRAQARV